MDTLAFSMLISSSERSRTYESSRNVLLLHEGHGFCFVVEGYVGLFSRKDLAPF
jgi:hypothetical protein